MAPQSTCLASKTRRPCIHCPSSCSHCLQEALFEEMGVDSDKMVGADFEGAKALVQPVKKLRR